MRLLCLVHDEWSAATTDRLASRELVRAVAVTDPAVDKVWRKSPAAARLARLTAGGESATDVDLVIVAGWPTVPDWVPAALPRVPWLLATATCGDGLAVADPVHWCIRNGRRTFRLHLHRTDPALDSARPAAETEVDLSGLDYRSGVDAAVEGLVALLPVAREAGDAVAVRSWDPLPVDRLALRVDWHAQADEVVRLVRSGAGRATTAWTYLNGFPISIGDAAAVEAAGLALTPGSVVRRDADSVVVQTGDGLVRLSGIRDTVGPIPGTVLRPGLRFGTDPDEELRMLRRRVADLERTVQWMLDSRT